MIEFESKQTYCNEHARTLAHTHDKKTKIDRYVCKQKCYWAFFCVIQQSNCIQSKQFPIHFRWNTSMNHVQMKQQQQKSKYCTLESHFVIIALIKQMSGGLNCVIGAYITIVVNIVNSSIQKSNISMCYNA